MKEEQAKAVELHEEKRAGEKKQVDEEKREEKHEEKERTIGDNGEEKVGETGEIGRAEKRKDPKMKENEEEMESWRSGSDHQAMVRAKRSTRLTKSSSVQVVGESKSKTESKPIQTHTKLVKVFHGLTFPRK